MSATDFNGNTVTTAYNKLNKETEVVTPMEENVTAKVKYFYDAAGNVTKQYQQNNKPGEAERFKLVETVYNSMNQPVSVISNDGNIDNIVKYEYDGIGNITKMATGITNINDAIDPSVHGVTTYTYNYLNQLVSTTDPQGNSVTNIYDKLGNVTNVTDKSGGTASYTYNGLGKVLSMTANRDGKTEDISYQYDWMGNIKQVSDSSGTTNYTYDGLGQLLKETKGGVVKDYTYDANGNCKSFKLTNSGTIELNTTYAYDIQNRLISVTNDGETTSYSYDNNGNLLSTTGAVNTQYTYNQANLLTAQTNRLGENVLGQYSVSYYLDGNKESIAESGKPTTSYLYDDMGRLTQEVIAGESQTIYQYDSFLNRSRKVEKDESGNVIKTNIYQYNKNNWLLEDRETAGESQENEIIRNFFYDNMGNQTMKTITTIGEATGDPSVTIGEDPNGIQLFEYDPLNRMTKSTINNVTTTYTYDGNGLRQSKTTNGVTTSHIYDGQNIVMDDKAGEKQIFHRGISLISRTVNGGSKEYYTFNTHGDTAQLVNASGTILKDYTYDAFGNQKQEQAEDNNPFRYCGEYFDSETGFIYLRARYYDSSIGRFTSEDPIKDGVNWFVYCANNPVNLWDPSGKAITTEDYNANYTGKISAHYWSVLYQADQLWKNAAEDDYSTKALARAMAVAARRSYDPNYVDDFDYTFGTGASALDDGSDGLFMKTVCASSSDGKYSAMSVIVYERKTINGRKYITIKEVRGYSRGNAEAGIYTGNISGYAGKEDFNGKQTVNHSSTNSVFKSNVDIQCMDDSGGDVFIAGATTYFYFTNGTCLVIVNNIYDGFYYNEKGEIVRDASIPYEFFTGRGGNIGGR